MTTRPTPPSVEIVGRVSRGVTDSEFESTSALNNRDTAERVKQRWKLDNPLAYLEDTTDLDPTALEQIVARVEKRAWAEVEYEERFNASLSEDDKAKNFLHYMTFINIESQIGWAIPDILGSWRNRAKWYGDVCGICFRPLTPDETIYIDRIYEDYPDEGNVSVVYGPVGGCCVGWKLRKVSAAADEAGAARGITWTYKDPTDGTRKETVISTPADCETCGRHMFVRSSSWFASFKHSFCSGQCKSRFYNKRRSEKSAAARSSKVCPICTREFTPKRSDAKTCGPACRQKMHRMWKSLED